MLPSEYIKKGFCKDAYARNASGEEVDPAHITATQWSLNGAILASIAPLTSGGRWLLYIEKLGERLYPRYVGYEGRAMKAWNDAPERTQDEVITLLEEIEKDIGFKGG